MVRNQIRQRRGSGLQEICTYTERATATEARADKGTQAPLLLSRAPNFSPWKTRTLFGLCPYTETVALLQTCCSPARCPLPKQLPPSATSKSATVAAQQRDPPESTHSSQRALKPRHRGRQALQPLVFAPRCSPCSKCRPHTSEA